jgi:hypothetical protein
MPRQLSKKALVNGVVYEAGTPEADIDASPGELASLIGAGHLVESDAVTTEAPEVTTEADDVTTEAPEVTAEAPAPLPKPKRSRKR